MLSLQSERWAELQHAYGSATDIPPLLDALRELPKSEGETEPWFSIWSALAHQGDVYSASFAAVSDNPASIDWTRPPAYHQLKHGNRKLIDMLP